MPFTIRTSENNNISAEPHGTCLKSITIWKGQDIQNIEC